MTEGRIRDVDFGAADSIQGNTTKRTKWRVLSWLHTFTFRGTGFGNRIGSRAKITEISVNRMLNEPEKMEGKVIAEITITEDMINTLGAMHAGCTMYLIDILSTLPLSALDSEQGGTRHPGVSQALHTVFHAPAPLGANLKIVSTSLSLGGRTMTCRSEIWDTTNHRLVASAVHVKMESSVRL